VIVVWQRWGILAALFIPLAFGIAAALAAVLGVTSGNGKGMLIGTGFVISAALLWLVVRAVEGRIIDKPKPAFVWQQLDQPVVDEKGVTQTRRAVPVTDPVTGEQLWTRPKSTLFFIPLKYLPFVLGGIGLFTLIMGAIASALGTEANLN
jgi:hypothetical protein